MFIGNRREIFADGAVIERLNGAALKLHAPKCAGVAFRFDAPWEGVHSCYCTLIQRGERALLYYRGALAPGDDRSEEQVTCLAQSKDGAHFSRSDLNIPGLQHNILLKGVDAHNFTPFYDENPACPEGERFKAVAGLSGHEAQMHGLYAYASPDGIRFHKMKDVPVITDGLFDSQNVAFFDTVAGVYRCYVRYWDIGGKDSDGFEGLRAIQSLRSRDFINWEEAAHNRYDGPVDEHLYTNAVIPCPGAEHVLLSFPKRFVPDRKKLPGHPADGVSEAIFMASRDGIYWPRLFREAWVRPGPDQNNWGDRSRMTARGVYQAQDGTLSVYVTAGYRTGENRLERYILRPQGFVSINGVYGGGEAVTAPLETPGGRLYLNASTSARGCVRVEVQDAQGRPLDGYGLSDGLFFGDGYDERYPLPPLPAGQKIRLRFYLDDADVYAFQIK